MVHGTVQLVGASLCITGWLVILSVNSTLGISNVGRHVRSPRVTAHVWMGYCTLSGIVLQVWPMHLPLVAVSLH